MGSLCKFKPWTIRLDNLTLEHEGGYYIDLERCGDSNQVLDWICQVANKAWADDRTLSQLVRALNAALWPQGTMCGMAMLRMIPNTVLVGLKARVGDEAAVNEEV